jgi:lysophospholipase L1-like esterase
VLTVAVHMVQPQSEDNFGYSNLSARPPGRLVTLAGRVVPGVARVQQQVGPYAASWALANQAALAVEGPLWVALGDSLSQGIGAPTYDRGWVGQLRTRLATAGHEYRLVNLSVSGARTEDVLEHQLPALATLAARAGMPDVITVMIGSNDLISRRYRDGLPRRFERILRQLPAGSLVTTLPNPTRTAAQVNDIIETVARQRGLVVAELRGSRTASWRGKLAADHFHPNERGYAQLADVIGDALNASLVK